MKNLLIKLGLWEEPQHEELGGVTTSFMDNYEMKYIPKKVYDELIKHHCDSCNRWFEKVQGKLMHDRHRHKDA